MYFIPLHAFAFYTTQIQDLLSVLFVCVGLHLLRTLQNIPYGIGPRVMAITKTIADRAILPFYLVLTVMVLIFAGGAQIAFGNEINEYRFLSSSVELMFFSMFGDFNMPLKEMQHSNVYLAYGLLGCVAILLTLVMMNIFIAVVSNVYERIENASEETYEKELDAYMFDQIPYGFIDHVKVVDHITYNNDFRSFDDESDNWKREIDAKIRCNGEELRSTKEDLKKELKDTNEKLEKILRMLSRES